jgi:hypothetical protein
MLDANATAMIDRVLLKAKLPTNIVFFPFPPRRHYSLGVIPAVEIAVIVLSLVSQRPLGSLALFFRPDMRSAACNRDSLRREAVYKPRPWVLHDAPYLVGAY